MKAFHTLVILSLVGLTASIGRAASEQQDYERSIQAVVRNKDFYKAGRIEIAGAAGVMPYDSLINHYMVGGRLTWHLHDHYAWEILDAQLSLSSVTGYAKNLVSQKGISNMQTLKLNKLVSTNFVLSPVYGKIRFLGPIVHFDVYLVAGLGMANTDQLRIFASGTGAASQEEVLRTGWDPMLNLGFGFKLFMNHAMALTIDFRDYLVFGQMYGKSSNPKSNFSVFAGLSFFLPTF